MNKVKYLFLFIFLQAFSQNDNKYFIKNILQDNGYDLNSFYVGATLNHSQLNTPIEDLFLSEFTYSTPENCSKQAQIHPSPGVWRWKKFDDYLDFANKNNITLRVHGPISPQASKWAKNDSRTKKELLTNMNEFFSALCIKVNEEPSVKWMDVVNETVNRNGTWFAEKPGDKKWENPWTQIGLNEDGIPIYIVRAFEIANEFAPNISLVYNQHASMEPVMWKKILETIIYLKERGLRVDGIGWQAHLKDIEDLAMDKEQLDFLASLIDWTHANGMDFHVTEMDYRIQEDPPLNKSLQRQSAAYSNIIKVLISRKDNGVVTFNTWGIIDRPGSHTNGYRFLFNKDLTPKPAMFAVKRTLMNKDTSLVLKKND
jgi:GH35 family endo-1,4-beta-xylanase